MVRHEIGDDEDAVGAQDIVRIGGRGAVGGLGDDLGLHAPGVLARDDAFERRRDEDVHGQLQELFVGDLLAASGRDGALFRLRGA